MKLIPCLFYLALALVLLSRNSSCICPHPQLLNLTRDGVFCSASSSMPSMACQNAWDSDSSTIWHPGTSGELAHTAIYMQDSLAIRRIRVEQYYWVSGYASKMELEVNGEHFQLKDVPGTGSEHSAMEWSAATPGQTDLTSRLVLLRITEVGPRSGSAFGGIQRIKIFGCFISEVEEPKKAQEFSPKTLKTTRTGVDEDIFLFDSLSSSHPGPALPRAAAGEGKQEAGELTLPLLGGGVVLLTIGLCVWMVVYGVRARKRYFVSESTRVRISPSSHMMDHSQDRLDMVVEDEEDIHTIPYP
eukprot:GFUD01003566.1.p1 GENE.GFUD01003566.1~~GFUD01003566.1.p1  ORF type:complete len:301 (+),score=86.52 GFUD01003566.1:40-942(+)